MSEQKRTTYGPTFVVSLLIAWSLLTPATAVAFWRTSDRSWDTAMPWLWLWIFTVLMPTVTSLRLHRRLEELTATTPDVPERIVVDLAAMRWLLPVFGTMAGLAALSLIVSR